MHKLHEAMETKSQSILYGVLGLVLGASLTFFVMSGNQNQGQPMEHDSSDTSMTMNQMTESLKGKTGDDFDQAFISSMIEHHQGAIDMAKEAQKNAMHEEIKNLANDIISAQTKEIQMMQDWQKKWRYQNGH